MTAAIQRWPLEGADIDPIPDFDALETRIEAAGSRPPLLAMFKSLKRTDTPMSDYVPAHDLLVEALVAHRLAPPSWQGRATLWKYSRGRTVHWTRRMIDQVRPTQISAKAPPAPPSPAMLQKRSQKLPRSWLIPDLHKPTVTGALAEIAKGKTPEELAANDFFTSGRYKPLVIFTSQLKYANGDAESPKVTLGLGSLGGSFGVTTTIDSNTDGANTSERDLDIVLVNDGLPYQDPDQPMWNEYLTHRRSVGGNPTVREWLYHKHGDTWKARERGPSSERLKTLFLHEATHGRNKDYDIMNRHTNVFERGVARFLTEFRAYLAGKDWQPPGVVDTAAGIRIAAANRSVAEDARRATAIGLVHHIFNAEEEVSAARAADKVKMESALKAFLPLYTANGALDFAAAWQAI